jgi:hypothetical protein
MDPDLIDFRSARIYWTDDETSHTNQLRRMKAVAADSVYLIVGPINSVSLKKLAVHVDARGTSSLGPAKPRTVAKREVDSDIVVNHYVRPTSKQTVSKSINLHRNESRFVYVIGNAVEMGSKYKQLNALLNVMGLGFAIVNDANAKRIAGDSHFIVFKDFLKQWKKWVPKDKHQAFIHTLKRAMIEDGDHTFTVYESLVKQSLRDTSLKNTLRILLSYNEDKALRVEVGNGYYNRMSYDDAVVKTVVKGIPELAEYESHTQAMAQFKKKYVLLGIVECAKLDGVPTAPALALYLNTAYKGAA